MATLLEEFEHNAAFPEPVAKKPQISVRQTVSGATQAAAVESVVDTKAEPEVTPATPKKKQEYVALKRTKVTSKSETFARYATGCATVFAAMYLGITKRHIIDNAADTGTFVEQAASVGLEVAGGIAFCISLLRWRDSDPSKSMWQLHLALCIGTVGLLLAQGWQGATRAGVAILLFFVARHVYVNGEDVWTPYDNVAVLRQSRQPSHHTTTIHHKEEEPLDLEEHPVFVDPKTLTPHPYETNQTASAVFYAVWNLAHVLLVYSLLVDPTGFWTWKNLVLHIVIAYFYEQFTFICGHLMYHASFATRFPHFLTRPEVFHYNIYSAWKHHYVDIRAFTTWWLPYRVSYAWTYNWNVFKGYPIQTLPVLSFAWMCYDLCTVGYVTYPIVLDVQIIYVWRHIQGITHEWYHIPSRLRSNYFYLKPVQWLFEAFEYCKIVDTPHHKEHHADDRHSLTMADQFWDMWVPESWNTIVTNYWQMRVKQFKPRELMGTDDLFKCDQQTKNTCAWANVIFRDAGSFWIASLAATLGVFWQLQSVCL